MMIEYKIGYFDDIVDVDDYIEKNGEFISNSEVVDILNEQEKEIRRLNYLVKIATNLIEWNTIPQIRREWQKHLRKVGGVDD